MESNVVCPFSSLNLLGLRLQVRLGCEEEERRIPQFVQFDIKVRFSSLPHGCHTDQLSETICYAELSNYVRKVCEKQEYQLIEKLGWDVFREIKKHLPVSTQLWLKTHKEKPPISDLIGGASFILSDWAEA